MKTVHEREIGWRIDYFIAANQLEKKFMSVKNHPETMNSDYCPINLEVNL